MVRTTEVVELSFTKMQQVGSSKPDCVVLKLLSVEYNNSLGPQPNPSPGQPDSSETKEFWQLDTCYVT